MCLKQAISVSNLMFYDIDIGLPGNACDTRIHKSTPVFAKTERSEILVAPEDVIQNIRVVS